MAVYFPRHRCPNPIEGAAPRVVPRGLRSSPDRKVAVQLDVVFATFPIIFLGELPDKTMFASLVLSTRACPVMVCLGAAAAFAVHVVIAVTVGVAIFHLLPHRAVQAIVAAMF